MRRRRWRCFWSWPLGHRWDHTVEGQHSFKRCRECGKTQGHHFYPGHHHHHGFGDGGGD